MLYYSVLHNNYRYKYILLFLNYYGGDNHSQFNPYIKGFRNNHLPLCFSCCLYHFEQRIPTGRSKMDNPEKLAAQSTQDEEKQSKDTRQYVSDTT